MIENDQTIGRVARKRKLARERLMTAALELIAEHGVEGLRLRELTQRADIGFGAFYTHFESREQLIEAVVAETVGALATSIITNAVEFDDPALTVAVAHRSFVGVAYDDPRIAWLIVHLDRADVLLEHASAAHLQAALERGLRSGRFRGIDADVTVPFLVGATVAVMRAILTGEVEPGADERSARAFLRTCGLSDQEAAKVAAQAPPIRSERAPQ